MKWTVIALFCFDAKTQPAQELRVDFDSEKEAKTFAKKLIRDMKYTYNFTSVSVCNTWTNPVIKSEDMKSIIPLKK